MSSIVRDGVRLHYECVESTFARLPLVLHGGVAGDLRTWKLAGHVGALAGRPLVLVDPRGHGMSGRPAGLAAHRIGEYVADVLEVLDAERIDRFAIWGHGDGGAVGLELCATAPERVVAAVVSGAIEHPAARPRVARAVRSLGVAELVRLIQRDEGELPAWLWLQYLDTDPEMLCLELEAWADWPGPWAIASEIAAPVLICVGEAEDPAGDAQRLAAELADGRCLRLPELGHLGAFLAPAQAAAVREFLAAL